MRTFADIEGRLAWLLRSGLIPRFRRTTRRGRKARGKPHGSTMGRVAGTGWPADGGFAGAILADWRRCAGGEFDTELPPDSRV